jgi:hypothetical protein
MKKRYEAESFALSQIERKNAQLVLSTLRGSEKYTKHNIMYCDEYAINVILSALTMYNEVPPFTLMSLADEGFIKEKNMLLADLAFVIIRAHSEIGFGPDIPKFSHVIKTSKSSEFENVISNIKQHKKDFHKADKKEKKDK